MKKLLLLLLALVTVVATASCEATGGTEIGNHNFALNNGNGNGYTYESGLNELEDLINGIFNDPTDINEMGRPITQPIVDFDDAVCMSAEGFDMLTRFYYYLICEYKYTEISQAYDFAIKAEDTDEYWSSYYPNTHTTRRDVVLEKVEDISKKLLATMIAMDDYGYEETGVWQHSYDNIVANYGSEKAMNEYLAAFGMTSELYKEYIRYTTAYNEFYEYLVGIDGLYYPSQEEQKQYYYDECYFFHQIVFPYTYTNDYGYLLDRSEDKIAEQRKKGEELYALIKDDPTLYEANLNKTEHDEWEQNRSGYFYIPEDLDEKIKEVYDSIEVGEIAAVDFEMGYYIIKKLPKSDNGFMVNSSLVQSSLSFNIYEREIRKYFNRISVDDEQINRYSFKEILMLR